MAGWAQERADTSKDSWGDPYGFSPFGDDPWDQYWIKEGIDDFNSWEQATDWWSDGQSCRRN